MSANPKSPLKGYEERDANVPWIVGIIIFVLVFGLSLHGILAGFLGALKRMPLPTDNWRPVTGKGAEAAFPPEPRLQVSAPVDLQAFRAREEMELHSYGWVNRTSGAVRIPIEQAMELVLREGLPTRTGTNKDQGGPSTIQLIQQRSEHREPEIKEEK